MAEKDGMHVISYVHTEHGLTEWNDLTPEQKTKAATRLKLIWLNGIFAGKAEFSVKTDSGG